MNCRTKWLGVALVAFLSSGCGTAVNTLWRTSDEGGKTPYGGVATDYSVLWQSQINQVNPDHPNPSPLEDFKVLFALIDLPFSALGDTLTLPYVLTYSAMRQRLSPKTSPSPHLTPTAEPAQQESLPGNAFGSLVNNKFDSWTVSRHFDIPVAANATVPKLTKANCEKLLKGMSQGEVEALLGKPHRSSDARKEFGLPAIDTRVFCVFCKWSVEQLGVSVWFDENDRLVDAFWETPLGSDNFEAPSWAMPKVSTP